jgi:hypothetical protein
MNLLFKGLIVGAVQLALVASIGGKFLYDRANYPRVWAEAAPYDPNLPIRGRYVSIALLTETARLPAPKDGKLPEMFMAHLEVFKDRLYAIEDEAGRHWITSRRCGEAQCWQLANALAFFIPGNVEDPSHRPAGETLWVEATVPPKGAPRPIRLGVKRAGDKKVTPLELKPGA